MKTCFLIWLKWIMLGSTLYLLIESAKADGCEIITVCPLDRASCDTIMVCR